MIPTGVQGPGVTPGSGQGVGDSVQPVNSAKRRRRRRPRSKRSGFPPKKADSLATSAPVMMEEEMEEALDQPRDSVLEMEKERDEAKSSLNESKFEQKPKPAISFSVISEEKKPKDADSMTYEAPVFMPTKAKIPEPPKEKPEPTSSPTPSEPDPWAQPQPVAEPDPWAQPQSERQPEPPSPPPADPWAQKEPTSAPTPTPAPAPFDDYKSPFDDNDPFAVSVNDALPQGTQEESAPPMVPASPFDPSIEPAENSMSAPQNESQNDSVAAAPEEPIEAEVVAESSVSSVESDLEKKFEPQGEDSGKETLSKKIETLLAEANLTPRHLKFCCGGVVFVIIVIILAFVLGPKLLKNGIPFFSQNDSGDETVVEDTNIETPPVEDTVTLPQQTTGLVWVDSSVYGGLLLGEPVPLPSGETGLDIGILLGEESPVSAESQFQFFLSDFESLYNLYYVDITALLDGSTDRAQTLDDHIQTLRDHYNQGATNYATIVEIRAQLKVEYDGVETDKQTAETQFFAEMKAFDGPATEKALAQFVELKQEQVELKAQYFAFGRLEYNYEMLLDSLLPRISDLEINREALIAGVQVVDILNSDLDLILSEQQALE